MKEDLLNIVWRHFKDILYDLWQAIRLTAGNKTVIIMNAAEGEKYSTFVPRLAITNMINMRLRDNLLPMEKLNHKLLILI